MSKSTISWIFVKWHTHYIYIDSNHVNFNKKYAYSKNKHISSWIDDLTSSTLNYFLQQWSSSKSRAICDFCFFIDYFIRYFIDYFMTFSSFDFFFSNDYILHFKFSIWHFWFRQLFVRSFAKKFTKSHIWTTTWKTILINDIIAISFHEHIKYLSHAIYDVFAFSLIQIFINVKIVILFLKFKTSSLLFLNRKRTNFLTSQSAICFSKSIHFRNFLFILHEKYSNVSKNSCEKLKEKKENHMKKRRKFYNIFSSF